MSASLVGSEMCIRDRPRAVAAAVGCTARRAKQPSSSCGARGRRGSGAGVGLAGSGANGLVGSGAGGQRRAARGRSRGPVAERARQRRSTWQ
eukprot:10375420-Alexandrium_andersonii.AAC.1